MAIVTGQGLEDRVRAALDAIVDPCSAAADVPAGLVEMGLVRDVEVTPGERGGRRVSVVLAVTHPSCMMAPLFLRDAERAVGGLAGVESVDVVLDADFEWTEEDLADEYRSRLLASRARRRDATTDRGGSDPAAPRELPARPEGRPGARAGSAASERSVLITRRRRG